MSECTISKRITRSMARQQAGSSCEPEQQPEQLVAKSAPQKAVVSPKGGTTHNNMQHMSARKVENLATGATATQDAASGSPMSPEFLVLVFSMLMGSVVSGVVIGLLWNLEKPQATMPVQEELMQLAWKRRNDNMQMFVDWFIENGGMLHENITLQQAPGAGWGFYAKGDIKKQDVVIATPRHLNLNAYFCLQSLTLDIRRLATLSSLPPEEFTPKLLMESLGVKSEFDNFNTSINNSYINTQRQEIVMALFLWANEDNKDNFWWPYIVTLPPGCQSAICWPKEKLKETFSRSSYLRILHEQSMIRLVASQLGLDGDEFLNQLSKVSSRIWQDSDDEKTGEQDVAVAVPMMDMMNHHVDSNSWVNFYESSNAGCYYRNIDWDYKAGDQVYFTYGEKDNADFVWGYGAIIPNNRHDNCEELPKLLSRNFIKKEIGMDCGADPYYASNTYYYLVAAILMIWVPTAIALLWWLE